MTDHKNDQRVVILTTKDQVDFLKMISYYSGKSVGEIIRFAITNMDINSFGNEVSAKIDEEIK